MKSKEIQKNKNIISNILNIGIITLIIILVINLITTKSDKLFEIVGFRSYIILSGSMEPKYYPGDIIITQHINKSDIKVNDIVTYKDKDEVVITHRIIKETENGYITKGDNNNVEDADVLTKDNIIGEVKFNIPKVGYIINILSKPLVIAVEMILLGIYIIFLNKEQ